MRFFQQLSVMPRRQGRLVLVVFLFDFMVFGHGLLLMLNSPERGDLVLLGSVVVAAAVLVGIAAVVRLVRWVGRGCPQVPPTVELLGLAKGLGVGAVVMLVVSLAQLLTGNPVAVQWYFLLIGCFLGVLRHHRGERGVGAGRAPAVGAAACAAPGCTVARTRTT